jgi:ABC-type antimicrobial peptide transport system permease subunit
MNFLDELSNTIAKYGFIIGAISFIIGGTWIVAPCILILKYNLNPHLWVSTIDSMYPTEVMLISSVVSVICIFVISVLITYVNRVKT